MGNEDNKLFQLGILDVFQYIFITLKCFELISWSWWKVLIPFWISLGVAIIKVIYILWNSKGEN